MSRPGWWRPRARRRWDREQANRERLVELLRQSPELRRVAENLRRSFAAALPTVKQAAENIRRACQKPPRGEA